MLAWEPRVRATETCRTRADRNGDRAATLSRLTAAVDSNGAGQVETNEDAEMPLVSGEAGRGPLRTTSPRLRTRRLPAESTDQPRATNAGRAAGTEATPGQVDQELSHQR